MPKLRFAKPIEERVALVTGGAKGLGRAAAVRLAEAGRHIAIVDVLEEQGTAACDEIRSLERRAEFFRCDVGDRADVERTVAQVMETFDRIDILVNAAGIIGGDIPLLETPYELWDRVLAINLSGTYYMSRTVAPHMAARGWGRIINFTSGARHGKPDQIPYCVSKAGIVPLTASFAQEFTRNGVLVNAIEPGRALTDMVVTRVPAEVVRNPRNPIGRYADPEELAEVICFLCSEANTYVSGGIVPVKGGAS
jgi:NAD(P)-dependent dehydrogenase (short-subunit alcohol dehydrogenase family)